MVVAGGAARKLEPRRVSQVAASAGSGVSRERLHPNKRLKLSAPAGAGWRCHLGRRACHKEVVDFIRCGRFAPQLKRGTLGCAHNRVRRIPPRRVSALSPASPSC